MNAPGTVQAMLRGALEAFEKRSGKKRKAAAPARESDAVAGVRSIRETSTFRVLEAMADGKDGEKVFRVILISEGPGNRRNKNFYGPEAVASSVKAFEGKWCYLNHQAADEAETLPERRIQDKAGYFKNLKVIEVKEGTACAGELHCDLSESGAMLAAKVQSALKYKESFPDNDLEYVGFSVNADGDSEDRDMSDKGGGPDDHYVTAITEGDSCDLVTTPARGGRGLAVLKESEGGNKEAGMKKKLDAILASLTEAFKSVKGDEAKKLSEALKPLQVLAKEADGMEAAAPGHDDEAKQVCAQREDESDEDHMARLAALGKHVAKHLGKSKEDESDPDGDDAHRSQHQKEDAADGDDDSDDAKDAQESKRDAIAGLIRESGLPKDYYTKEMIAHLVKKSYSEAKREIAKDARLAKSILESAGLPVASLHRGLAESGGENNDAAFIEAARGE